MNSVQGNSLYRPGIWSISQDKHKVDNFLTVFANALKTGDSKAKIDPFPHNENGCIAKFQLEDSQEDTFVLKFETSGDALNEKFCARILSDLGMITPKVRLIKPEKRNGEAILGTFYVTLQVPKSKHVARYLIFMPAFKALTLDELIENKELERFSKQNLDILFKKIGELSIYDLLIGYTDRFFNLGSTKENVFTHPYVNGGNTMIAWPLENDLRVLAIDNLVTGYGWAPQLCKNAFIHVVKNGHTQEFANHILAGFTEDYNFPDVFPIEEGEKSLLAGIQQGCQKLQKLDCETFCQALEPHAKGQRAQDTFKLVKENLSILHG